MQILANIPPWSFYIVFNIVYTTHKYRQHVLNEIQQVFGSKGTVHQIGEAFIHHKCFLIKQVSIYNYIDDNDDGLLMELEYKFQYLQSECVPNTFAVCSLERTYDDIVNRFKNETCISDGNEFEWITMYSANMKHYLEWLQVYARQVDKSNGWESVKDMLGITFERYCTIIEYVHKTDNLADEIEASGILKCSQQDDEGEMFRIKFWQSLRIESFNVKRGNFDVPDAIKNEKDIFESEFKDREHFSIVIDVLTLSYIAPHSIGAVSNRNRGTSVDANIETKFQTDYDDSNVYRYVAVNEQKHQLEEKTISQDCPSGSWTVNQQLGQPPITSSVSTISVNGNYGYIDLNMNTNNSNNQILNQENQYESKMTMTHCAQKNVNKNEDTNTNESSLFFLKICLENSNILGLENDDFILGTVVECIVNDERTAMEYLSLYLHIKFPVINVANQVKNTCWYDRDRNKYIFTLLKDMYESKNLNGERIWQLIALQQFAIGKRIICKFFKLLEETKCNVNKHKYLNKLWKYMKQDGRMRKDNLYQCLVLSHRNLIKIPCNMNKPNRIEINNGNWYLWGEFNCSMNHRNWNYIRTIDRDMMLDRMFQVSQDLDCIDIDIGDVYDIDKETGQIVTHCIFLVKQSRSDRLSAQILEKINTYVMRNVCCGVRHLMPTMGL